VEVETVTGTARPRPLPGPPPTPGPPRPAPGAPSFPSAGAAADPQVAPADLQAALADPQAAPAGSPFAGLAELPVTDHVAVYEAEHERLQRELSTIDQL
jgi:hypothetical protein